MGGGAKGAYQLGVWRAIWNLGVRKLVTITGTSAGALNAFLFANGDPNFAEKTWDEVISTGVLESKHSLLGGTIALLVAHLLIYISVVIALVLLLSEVIVELWISKFQSGNRVTDNLGLFFGAATLCLMFCLLAARLDSDFLDGLSKGGYALPLFGEHSKQITRLMNTVFVFGCVLFLSWILKYGFPSRHLAGWLVWLVVPFWFLLLNLRYQGLRLLYGILRAHPLFERDALNATIAKLTAENKLFLNCVGPVIATLARHAAYHNPFKVHPLAYRYKYDVFIEECVPAPEWKGFWRYAKPLAQWVPEYIDLRKTEDPARVLSATSAIPFAWKALVVTHRNALGDNKEEVFVDGGVVDNLPICPALQVSPEFIIVIALNASDTLGDESTLKQRIQENWQQSFFSKQENNDVANNLRDEWIKSLPPSYFVGHEELAKFLARRSGSFLSRYFPVSTGPFPAPPQIGPDFRDTKVIFLRPSKATALDLPILGLITGTIRFTPAYKKKLVSLGIKDAEVLFTPFQPSRRHENDSLGAA